MDWLGLAAALLRYGMLVLMVGFLWTLLKSVKADLERFEAGVHVSGEDLRHTGAEPDNQESYLQEFTHDGRRVPAVLEVVVSTGEKLSPGRIIPLTRDLTLGRGEGNQVMVEDAFASHRHARIWAENGVYRLEDLGSTNGTFRNGQRIGEPTILEHGDLIKVGGATFRLAVRSFAN